MSPSNYNGGAIVFFVYSTGRLGNSAVYNTAPGVRPVINLKSSVQITGGDGSSGNPYVIF